MKLDGQNLGALSNIEFAKLVRYTTCSRVNYPKSIITGVQLYEM